MFPNAKPFELKALLSSIDPASQAAGTVVSGWLPVANFHAIEAFLATGVLGASATVDAKFQQAKDASGTSAKDITGKAITQIVKATGDNKQAFVDVRPSDLDTDGGFTHVQFSITVGTAASIVSAFVFGFYPRELPGSKFNEASVVQLV